MIRNTAPMTWRKVMFGDPRPATAAKAKALLDGITQAARPLIAAFCSQHSLPMGDTWPG